MTDSEWNSVAQLYREIWKAHADLAAMRGILTAAELAIRKNYPDEAMKSIREWREAVERLRGSQFYSKCLGKGEEHLAQAERERSDKLLIELLSQDPPPELPWKKFDL